MNQAALLPYFVEFLNRSILQLGSTYINAYIMDAVYIWRGGWKSESAWEIYFIRSICRTWYHSCWSRVLNCLIRWSSRNGRLGFVRSLRTAWTRNITEASPAGKCKTLIWNFEKMSTLARSRMSRYSDHGSVSVSAACAIVLGASSNDLQFRCAAK